MKNKFKITVILFVIGIFTLVFAAGVLLLYKETDNVREDVVIYTEAGALTEGYKSYEEYSNDKTLQNADNMPDYINGEDTVVTDNTQQNTASYNYCGNKNSKVYHKTTCTSLSATKEENKVYYSSKQEYINNGYKGCSRCNP